MDFQGLELNSREAARRLLPIHILKHATRCRDPKKNPQHRCKLYLRTNEGTVPSKVEGKLPSYLCIVSGVKFYEGILDFNQVDYTERVNLSGIALG